MNSDSGMLNTDSGNCRKVFSLNQNDCSRSTRIGVHVESDWVFRLGQKMHHAGNVDGVSLCRMFNTAISIESLPKYLSSDNDPLFQYYRWQANLRILDIQEIKTLPHVPLSHPFVERLIGTIRREFLDQTLFWYASDLERKLADYRHYYNTYRTHASLNGTTPAEKSENRHNRPADIKNFHWRSHCRGLYQLPMTA